MKWIRHTKKATSKTALLLHQNIHCGHRIEIKIFFITVKACVWQWPLSRAAGGSRGWYGIRGKGVQRIAKKPPLPFRLENWNGKNGLNLGHNDCYIDDFILTLSMNACVCVCVGEGGGCIWSDWFNIIYLSSKSLEHCCVSKVFAKSWWL